VETGNQALLAELAALRKRVAELESFEVGRESELVWTHSKLLEQITQENRQAEVALRLSEQKLSRIFSESPDAIAISSLKNGRYVEINTAFERVFGYTRDEALGRVATELGIWPQPMDRQRISDLLHKHGELLNIELRFRHKSGRIFDCLLSASLIEIDEEPCMMSITRDISERKRYEHVVQEQNRMLHALGQAQADFIADADPHLTFRQLLSHLLDITDSEYGFIGEIPNNTTGPVSLRPFAVTDITWDETARQHYQSRLSYLTRDFEFQTKGTLFDCVISLGEQVISNDPAQDPRGSLPVGHRPLQSFMGLPLYRGDQLVGMLGLGNRPAGFDEALIAQLQPFTNTCAMLIEAYRNNLGRQEAESRLRQFNEELEARVTQRTAELQTSLNELESFSYSVSHDLRSPLRGINGFSHLLAENYTDQLGEEGKDYLQRIRAATLRMSDLIDSLLELSQLTREPMHITEVNLTQHAENIIEDLLQTQQQQHNAPRAVEFVIAQGVRGYGDDRLLRIALQNLLANAWKFTERKASSRIEFGVYTPLKNQAESGSQGSVEDKKITYFVRDSGAGFDMQYAGRLFRSFERLHDAYEFSGTGIGLATVQRIIQRHGGVVRAEGVVGEGACFYFTLPVPTGTIGIN